MQSNRRNQSQQVKQWKQQWKVNARKLDEYQKSSLKILSTFSQVNPQSAAKTNNIISEYEVSLKKGQKQSQNVYGKLKKIYQSVQQLRETLKYFDKTNESLMKVQKLSQGIFMKMENMKNDMAISYDQLDEMQQKISNDLDLIDKRISRFDEEDSEDYTVNQNKAKSKQNNLSVQNKNSSKQINKKSNQKNKQESEQQKQQPLTKLEQIQIKMKAKQDEVEKVDEQIRDLGKFLGWHEQDHKDFLTIWNRNQPNKTYFQIQDQLVQYFKMYTNQQIIDHMNKYMKFKKLNEKKKFLINQYKELKQDKRAEQIVKLKLNQQQKQIRIRKQQQIKKNQQDQKQMKQKVQLWKKQKKQMENQQKQKAIQQQQKKRKQQINKRKQQQAKRKQIIDRWKEQQQQKQKQKMQQIKKQQVRRPQSAANKQTRQRIRERQQQIIKQKMEKAIQKKMQQQQRQKRVQKIKQQKLIKFAHVNSKLQEKTTAVKEKERQKFDGKDKKEANTFGGQLLLTGVRAIPQWRQGL